MFKKLDYLEFCDGYTIDVVSFDGARTKVRVKKGKENFTDEFGGRWSVKTGEPTQSTVTFGLCEYGDHLSLPSIRPLTEGKGFISASKFPLIAKCTTDGRHHGTILLRENVRAYIDRNGRAYSKKDGWPKDATGTKGQTRIHLETIEMIGCHDIRKARH